MVGKIEVVVEKGRPIRNDLKYYPFWSLKITPRNKKEKDIIVTPKYAELKKILKEILVHELRADVAIGKRNEFKKYREFFSPEYIEEAQRKITEYGLPEIYRKCKK